MMQIKKSFILITFMFLLVPSVHLIAQTNNLTSSPYSLFGLGVESNSNIGVNSGMGNAGISLESSLNAINLSNPAALATLPEKNVIMDAGFVTQIDLLNNGNENEIQHTTSFSNLALAMNPNGKYGVGLSLLPATNVGYSLIGLENTVEGSTETYYSNITGSGGINDVRFDYGRHMTKNLNLGFRASYLFGKINETENVVTSTSLLTLDKSTYYSGMMVGFGLQYKIFDKYHFGFILDSPTTLSAKQDTYTTKTTLAATTIVDEASNESIDSFKLPLKMGLGFNTTFNKFLVAVDVKRNFWSATNQSDQIGVYKDQTVIGVGSEYINNISSYKYVNRISYRAGFNFDTGYLMINDQNVSSRSFSLGLGLPVGLKGSRINISYTYKNSGSLENILIKESSNTININLSLSDFWFEKRKYD